jgi:hypothetical protein
MSSNSRYRSKEDADEANTENTILHTNQSFNTLKRIYIYTFNNSWTTTKMFIKYIHAYIYYIMQLAVISACKR